MINLDTVTYVDGRGLNGGGTVNFVGQEATEEADYISLSEAELDALIEWAQQDQTGLVIRLPEPADHGPM